MNPRLQDVQLHVGNKFDGWRCDAGCSETLVAQLRKSEGNSACCSSTIKTRSTISSSNFAKVCATPGCARSLFGLQPAKPNDRSVHLLGLPSSCSCPGPAVCMPALFECVSNQGLQSRGHSYVVRWPARCVLNWSHRHYLCLFPPIH